MFEFDPQPLPRDDVHVVYNTMANSPVPLTLTQVAAKCPRYSIAQVYWACGTMTQQGIIAPCGAVRSDRSQADPHFDVKLPFDGYIGWEQAK